MTKLVFSNHINNVFSEMGTNYEEIKNLMFDLYRGELSDGVTKREANDKLREMTQKIFGIDKNSSRRDRERAYRAHAREFFDVIEEVSDFTVTTGLRENEWFEQLVNYKNLKDGDENLFTVKPLETILAISRMGKRHHDTRLQRLPQGSTYQIDTDLYGAAVGADIDRFILGQEDFTELTDALTKAFVVMVQDLIFTALYTAYQKLPTTGRSQFVQSGQLNTTNRNIFNKTLQNVSVANDNSPVIIMGTMVGLQQLENLIQINWIADSQKESVANMGRLGNYGRYQLVEIPQRFARNDVTKDMYKDEVLFFFASGDNKMINMVDVGETLIDEITERGEANGRIDDIMKYEIQRELGIDVHPGRWFGQWTITTE